MFQFYSFGQIYSNSFLGFILHFISKVYSHYSSFDTFFPHKKLERQKHLFHYRFKHWYKTNVAQPSLQTPLTRLHVVPVPKLCPTFSLNRIFIRNMDKWMTYAFYHISLMKPDAQYNYHVLVTQRKPDISKCSKQKALGTSCVA